jgi:glycosyltransferase involved in cell wall biosynthesis
MTISTTRSVTRHHILTFSSLYPNKHQPRHGIFVENRMKELYKTHSIDITVVAPIPWFPFKGKRFGQYGIYASVPRIETRDHLTVHHPRYLVLPKIGMNLAPLLMAISLFPFVRKLYKSHAFDLIDGHFLYPEGVVATLFGKWLNLPVINTARGNDITLYTQYSLPRRQIKWALENSDATVSVCEFLSNEIKSLGVKQTNNLVMRNGVDLDLFQESNREATREKLKLNRFTLISVGHFIERKGHHLIIEALPLLPDCQLILVGDGPMEQELKQKVESLGLTGRVIFTGGLRQQQLPEYYSAADCLVLASSREGWANVLLESMACGTPVVATRVSGTPEVVLNDTAGLLIDFRSADGIARGVRQLQECYPSRAAVRVYASGYSWTDTSNNLYALIDELVNREILQEI